MLCNYSFATFVVGCLPFQSKLNWLFSFSLHSVYRQAICVSCNIDVDSAREEFLQILVLPLLNVGETNVISESNGVMANKRLKRFSGKIVFNIRRQSSLLFQSSIRLPVMKSW